MNKLFILSIPFIAIQAAAEHCSLRVTVLTPSGEPVTARILVEEKNGWKLEQQSTPGPTNFCGLGIHPVSVTVGDEGCNQVVVRNVPLKWDETTHLTVTYDMKPCLGETPPVAACDVLLRVIGVKRDPVDGATFEEQKPFPELRRGDVFGRIFIRIAAGQELTGIASARGYRPAQIKIPCVSRNQRHEQIVVLERSDR